VATMSLRQEAMIVARAKAIVARALAALGFPDDAVTIEFAHKNYAIPCAAVLAPLAPRFQEQDCIHNVSVALNALRAAKVRADAVIGFTLSLIVVESGDIGYAAYLHSIIRLVESDTYVCVTPDRFYPPGDRMLAFVLDARLTEHITAEQVVNLVGVHQWTYVLHTLACCCRRVIGHDVHSLV
jgi:hypothetical protein